MVYTDNEYELKKYTSLAWNLFWIGFVLYTVSFCFPGLNISLKFFQAIQILGIILFVAGSIYLVSWRIEHTYLRIVFFCFMLWNLITIMRGFNFNYEFLKILLFHAPFSIFIYFVPLVLVFKRTIENLNKLFVVIIVLNVIYLIYTIIYWDLLYYGVSEFYRIPTVVTETFSHFLSIPAAYILLTYRYHNRKRIVFALFVIAFTFFMVTIRARRGLMFITLTLMIFSYLMFYFTNRGQMLKVILSVVLVLMVVFYAYGTYSRKQDDTFNLITTRIDEDTRKGIEEMFYSDMSTLDLIIGRGINGQYYCPGIDEQKGNITVYRSVIETGYLQIALKGGAISLALYFFIIMPAIYKGLFLSKNMLSKASSIWIILYTVFLYPTYVNIFSLTYLIIWIAVGICYNKEIRNKTDDEIMTLIKPDRL